jgi:phosphate transport system permease protein
MTEVKTLLAKSLRSPYFDQLFKWTMAACAWLGIAIVAFVIFVAISRGFDRLSFDFLASPSQSDGTQGGILYQILGTLILLGTATIVVCPFACGIAVLEHTTSKKWLKTSIGSILHLLNATPSILFGILGFVFFVKFCNWDKSWLGGGIILALMILPTVTLSLISRLETIPTAYIDTARALGLDDDQLVGSILLPYGWGGLLTGLVMGLARAAGETAPIMFTAVVFAGATFPDGVQDNPVLALPYHIFNLAQDVLSSGGLITAWATAAVLILFVLGMSLVAAPLRSWTHEEANH